MISVIMAAYNAGKFIKDAIESVTCQKDVLLELIVVNDGSSDSTLQIARVMAEKDARISVVTISHGGQSAARNAGISRARGKYLFFIDADDIIHPAALSHLKSLSEETDADIACGGIRNFRSHTPHINHNLRKTSDLLTYSGRDATIDILYQHGDTDNSMCGKLFLRHLFHNEIFRESTAYEDLDLFYRIFLRANRVTIDPQPLYFYRQHPDSFIHTSSPRRADILDVTQRLRQFMENSGDSTLAAAARSRQLSANFNIMLLTLRNPPILGKEADRALRLQCLETIEELSPGCLHDRNVRIKNKIAILLRKPFAHL